MPPSKQLKSKEFKYYIVPVTSGGSKGIGFYLRCFYEFG